MKIMVRNRQRKFTIGIFIKEKAMIPTNIIAGFKKTGILERCGTYSTNFLFAA